MGCSLLQAEPPDSGDVAGDLVTVPVCYGGSRVESQGTGVSEQPSRQKLDQATPLTDDRE